MRLLMRFAYLLFCAACAVLLTVGCAPAAQKHSVSPSADQGDTPLSIGEAESDPTEPEVAADDDSTGIDIETDIDELLREARQACADSLFAAADTMLRRAAAFLMKNSELPEPDSGDGGEWFPLQDYVADIISIYSELMPSGFSAPEEISAMIFSRHLLESLLDSLTISPEDSVFLARLSSKRGVSYDVPMVWNNRVKRAMLFYLRTRKGVFDRWLYRSSYYLPVMKQMFADSSMPQDLAHLPIIESGFNAHAYSRAHAAGIWQFIPSTGRYYGLRQNYWLDERRDPIKSTDAAIRYLRKLYGDFNNWHIALASYNCGENGMARAIKKSGTDGSDYWSLSLPKETMNYVPLFLAALVIAKNPDVFEFTLPEGATFDPDTASISDCVEMASIAAGIEVPLDTLTRLNPHILHWCTPPDVKNVRIYLPKGSADKFKEFYDSLPDEKKTKFYRYKIKSGDNMLQIARDFRVPVEALREMNKMKTNHISAGKFIIIPIPVNDSVPSALAAYLNNSDRQRPARTRSGSGSAARGTGTVVSRSGKRVTYKVRTGETLYSISNLFGVSVKDLMAWNYLANPRSLKAEQTLVIYQQQGKSASDESDDDDIAAPSPKAGSTASAPSSGSAQQASSTPTAQRVRGNAAEYSGKRLVKQGETLYGISLEVGVSVNELARINGLNARRPLIFPGDVLVYTPRPGQSAAQEGGAAANPSASASAARTPAAQPAAPSAQRSGQVVLYTVKQGDNLWRISLNFGVTVDSIREDNNLTARSVIMPGDILRIIR